MVYEIWGTISNVENGKSVLHGVTSFSTGGCGSKEFPGMVFANVYAMKGFIEDVLVRFPYFFSDIFVKIFGLKLKLLQNAKILQGQNFFAYGEVDYLHTYNGVKLSQSKYCNFISALWKRE